MDNKYYFLGYWYPIKVMKEELLNLSNKFVDLKNNQDFDIVLELLAKDDPQRFSILCRKLYEIRLKTSI